MIRFLDYIFGWSEIKKNIDEFTKLVDKFCDEEITNGVR